MQVTQPARFQRVKNAERCGASGEVARFPDTVGRSGHGVSGHGH
ncbi:hypothetical protein [Streptomyces sp. NPDC054958]